MRRSVFYIVIAGLQALGSIGSPLLVARRMGPAELGVVAVCLLVIVLVRAVASLGLYGPISVALHEGEQGIRRARKLLRWTSIMCLPVSGVLVLATLATGGVASAYLFATAAGFAGAVALGHQALHRSVANHTAYALAVLGPTAVASVGALGFTLAWGGSARGYVGTMAVISLTTSAYLHFKHLRGVGKAPTVELRQALKVGSALILSSAATVGLSLGDRPLVQAWLGEAEAGRYHVAYILAAGGIPLLGAANNAWLPAVLQAPVSQRLRVLGHTTREVVRGVLVLTVGAVIASPALVQVIAGAAYVGPQTSLLAAVIAMGVVPYAVYSGVCIGLLSVESTGAIALATGLGLLANLLVNAILLPTVGLIGAGVASVLGYVVAATVAWRSLKGRHEMAWVDANLGAWGIAASMIVAGLAFLPIPEGRAALIPVAVGGFVGVLGCALIARATSLPHEMIEASEREQ